MALLAWWSAAEAKLITKFNKKLYTITFCSYATQNTWFIKFWSAHHIPWTIWHLSLGYRGISIIRGKVVAISNHRVLSAMIWQIVSFLPAFGILNNWSCWWIVMYYGDNKSLRIFMFWYSNVYLHLLFTAKNLYNLKWFYFNIRNWNLV